MFHTVSLVSVPVRMPGYISWGGADRLLPAGQPGGGLQQATRHPLRFLQVQSATIHYIYILLGKRPLSNTIRVKLV